MHNYWNENTWNDTFHFSVSVVELEFQQIGFLAYHFFLPFIRKLTQVFILTLFFRILGGLTEKRIFLYRNKNFFNFYVFTIKTDYKNVSESKKFRRKTEQNRLKMSTLPPFFFFQETTVFFEKRKTLNDFLF